MTLGKVVAVVGAQFGSEAKGVVAYELADQFDVAIRTGGPNAGHTFYHNGQKFVARSIPCGWVNPNAWVVIGPGAVLDLEVFAEEYNEIKAVYPDIGHRIWIDRNAGIITKAQHHGEGGIHGYAHQAIGSTGEGVGLARIARISRQSILDPENDLFQFKRVEDAQDELTAIDPALKFSVIDTVQWVNGEISLGSNVLLEGTQGSGLSLVHGPWPYCTSADTNAGQLAVDAGISPSLVTETILVARTFPIRVAGNSGPLPNETTFAEIGQEEERTTVTKKIRRIARWDDLTVAKAVTLNRPAKIALMFTNYLYPETAGVSAWEDLSPRLQDWMTGKSKIVGAPIVAAGTSPTDLAIKPGELQYT